MLKYAFSECKIEQFLELAIVTEKELIIFQTVGVSMLPFDLLTSNNKSRWL